MIFMVENTEKIAYDPEFNMWFTGHPFAPPHIFAPIKWIRLRFKKEGLDHERY